MSICRWCGKRIKKGDARITLTKGLHFDHVECNEERVKSIKEKYGIDQDYTQGQQKLV